MVKEIEQLDNEQLLLKLKAWLESAPLYTEYRFIGGSLIRLPGKIELLCEQCQRKTEWKDQTNRQGFPNDRLQLQQRTYMCGNCKEQRIHFAYSWFSDTEKVEGKEVSVFRKYGQWPPPEERVKQELQKALEGTDDLKFYKTALRLRNFGFGIGAMLYMRRVIENHMNEMIQILKEEAKKGGEAENGKEEIPTRFRDKIDYAEKLLPAHLKPDNLPNPMKPLYTLTSDAIHNLSEIEATTNFDQCRTVFEYVFSSLRPALNEQKEYLEGLKNLTQMSASKSA